MSLRCYDGKDSHRRLRYNHSCEVSHMSKNLPQVDGYMVFDKDQTLGPFRLSDLRVRASTGQFSPGAQVCQYGKNEWQPLSDLLGAPQVSKFRIPTLHPEVDRSAELAALRRKRIIIACLVVGVLALIYAAWHFAPGVPFVTINGSLSMPGTNGVEVRLSSVEVAVYSEDAIKPVLLRNSLVLVRKIESRQEDMAALKPQIKEIEAKADRLTAEAEELRKESYKIEAKMKDLRSSPDAESAEKTALIEGWQAKADQCVRLADRKSSEVRALREKTADMTAAMDDLIAMDGITDKLVFTLWDNLPQPSALMPTDATGGFRLELDRQGKYWVMARFFFKETGEYAGWVVPVEIQKRGPVELNLDQANMVSRRGFPFLDELRKDVGKLPPLKLGPKKPSSK